MEFIYQNKTFIQAHTHTDPP